MKYLPRLLALFLTFLFAVMAFFVAFPLHAQIDQYIFVDKKLGRTSPVVHVGEYITFTIRIENRTSFTVTTLPLSDTFNIDVLGFADSVPSPDVQNPNTGRLDWTDLTNAFGDLGPGQVITVVTGFIAEHPAPAVVNYAAVHDAQGNQGGVPGGTDTSDNGESVGGSSPVVKKLTGGLPVVGLPITFTISITNNGYTSMTILPLLDTYDPAALQFKSAVPPPDSVDDVTGEIVWSNLTYWFGDLPANGSVQVTTVFTALVAIEATNNKAEVAQARDWYGNELGGGADLVPIQIVSDISQLTPTPAATATAVATSDTGGSGGGGSEATSTPSATSTSTSTSNAATSGKLASEIAATGIPPQTNGIATAALALLAAALPLAGWWLVKQKSIK